MPVTLETRNNTAESIAADFGPLEGTSRILAKGTYSKIDVHMTDSKFHNKGIAKNLAETFHRKEIAGQIFSDCHGFHKGIVKTIHNTENKIGIQNIFSGFLLDINIDQRNNSVSISTLSWCLSLFGPENINKPWTYYTDFCTFL